MKTATASERARVRATSSRLRAIYHAPTFDRVRGVVREAGYYTVYNLDKHVHYTVWFNTLREAWECTCQANNLKTRCKHVQRVMDREDKRVKQEALQDETYT
jgi:hypothetical protein